LDLVRDLVGSGWRVLVGESRPWTVAGGSRGVREVRLPAPQEDLSGFQECLARICRSESVQFLQPTCEEVLSVAQGRERLPSGVSLRIPPFALLARLHHKGGFVRACREAGLPAPWTESVEPGSVAGLGGIAKPVWSRSGGRTRRILPGDRLPDEPGWILQEELVGSELCTFSACRDGRVVAHAAYRPVLRRGFGPSWGFVSADPHASLAWVQRFLSTHPCDGFLGFDLMDTAQGLFPMECNPRATSGIHFLRGTGWTESFFGDAAGRSPILAPAGVRLALSAAVPFLLPGEALRHPAGFARSIAFLARCRDPVLRLDDPMPYFRQIPSAISFLRLSRRLGIGAEAAVSHDLEWNRPHPSLEEHP
jgi:hypothetical protein